MAETINLFFVGLLFLNFGLYAASDSLEENEYYDEKGDRYPDHKLTQRTAGMIALGCFIVLGLMITICFYKRTRSVNNRTAAVGDRNPYHAGYNQIWNQPTSPPSYNENVSLHVAPLNTDSVQKEEHPSLYSPKL